HATRSISAPNQRWFAPKAIIATGLTPARARPPLAPTSSTAPRSPKSACLDLSRCAWARNFSGTPEQCSVRTPPKRTNTSEKRIAKAGNFLRELTNIDGAGGPREDQE